MSLRFYLAGSLDQGSRIKECIQIVKEMGHEISFDWTVHASVKPYQEHSVEAGHFAEQALAGAKNCDVFVLIPNEDGGTTQFTELGAAIFSEQVKYVFVVGPYNTRSMAFFHPRVTRVESFQDVLEKMR